MNRGSFLNKSEKEYLEAYNCYLGRRLRKAGEEAPRKGEKAQEPNCDERKAKHRIDKEVGRNIGDILHQFQRDLMAVEAFYLHIKPDGWYEFSDVTLQHTAINELESLRDHLDTLIEQAESDFEAQRREAIGQLLSLLSEDLDHHQKYYSGDPSILDKIERENGDIVNPPQLVDDVSEHQQRKEALTDLLTDGGLLEIFEWVAEHERQKVPDQTKRDTKETWKQCIGRYLRAKNSLVEEAGWGYELTNRGNVILECWTQIKQCDPVEERADSVEEKRQVAARLTNRYFGWEA